MNSKYKLDIHTHTISSGHAYSTINENAQYAAKIGLEILGMTDHAPKMPGSANQLHFVNLHVIPNNLYGVEILKGAELNIMDNTGKVDLHHEVLSNLDIAIASLHPPCIPIDRYKDYTETLVNTIKNPNINIIGHPGDPRYPFDIKTVVSAARDYNTLLEINNSSLSPDSYRAGSRDIIPEILKECKRQSLPVILGSDAHYFTYIGDFRYIQPILEAVDMPDELIINTSPDKFKKFVSINK